MRAQAVDEPAKRLLGVLEGRLQPVDTLETPSAPELQQAPPGIVLVLNETV